LGRPGLLSSRTVIAAAHIRAHVFKQLVPVQRVYPRRQTLLYDDLGDRVFTALLAGAVEALRAACGIETTKCIEEALGVPLRSKWERQQSS